MLTCYAIRSEAQRIIQVLPDDSFIVEIAGKGYRAINADKVREIQKQKIDLDAAQRINAEKDIQIRELNLIVQLKDAQAALERQRADSFKADFERSQTDAKRNFSLFMGERDLRVEGQQFIPHGKTAGFWSKVLGALDHPASQAFFKIGVPLYSMVRCSR